MEQTVQDILQFWFGELDQAGMCTEAIERRWFVKDAQLDQQISQQFGALVEQAINGDLDWWARSNDGLIALVLLLDQFTRNIFRDKPQAFSGDQRALACVREAVAAGRDKQLPRIHRVFLYIPYEHSEDLAAQNEGVALLELLATECSDPRIERFLDYAVAHRDIIARFGRFPHRNRILGRDSNQQEQEHLREHGGF